MSELCYPCIACHRPSTDEYHWWMDDEDGVQEIVWKLCGECCEFAVEVVECISNLEEELEAWLSQSDIE